jgi:hypothetical protein
MTTLKPYQMHKQARDFAIKHRLGLGRMQNGQYYLADGDQVFAMSNEPTLPSAMTMMRRCLRGGV